MDIDIPMEFTSDLKYFIWIILSCLTQVIGIRGSSIHPRFLSSPSHLTFNRGETALLTCTVKNLGTKTITWRKLPYITPITAGGKLFAQDSRFEAVHIPWKDQWNLSIKNVQVQDAGIYECQVGTRGKKLRQNITLTVIDVVLTRKPEIRISGTEFPEKGGSVFLLCNATGKKYPPDNIEWYKDGERLFTESRIYIREHVAQNAGVLTSSLEIINAKLEDNGTYICRATSLTDEPMITRMNVNVLSAGSNYAKRGTINHTAKPESIESHDAARLLNSTVGLISFLVLVQVILHIVFLT